MVRIKHLIVFTLLWIPSLSFSFGADPVIPPTMTALPTELKSLIAEALLPDIKSLIRLSEVSKEFRSVVLAKQVREKAFDALPGVLLKKDFRQYEFSSLHPGKYLNLLTQFGLKDYFVNFWNQEEKRIGAMSQVAKFFHKDPGLLMCKYGGASVEAYRKGGKVLQQFCLKFGRVPYQEFSPEQKKELEDLIQAAKDSGHLNYQTTGGYDISEQTALISAVRCNQDNMEMVEKLLEQGADPNLQTINDHSALSKVITSLKIRDQNQDMVKLLLKYGADPFLTALNGRSGTRTLALKRGDTPLGLTFLLWRADLLPIMLDHIRKKGQSHLAVKILKEYRDKYRNKDSDHDKVIEITENFINTTTGEAQL